jgi:hypothetical protein
VGSAPRPPSALTLQVNEKTAVYSSTVKMTLCPEPKRLECTAEQRLRLIA